MHVSTVIAGLIRSFGYNYYSLLFTNVLGSCTYIFPGKVAFKEFGESAKQGIVLEGDNDSLLIHWQTQNYWFCSYLYFRFYYKYLSIFSKKKMLKLISRQNSSTIISTQQNSGVREKIVGKNKSNAELCIYCN